MSVWDTLGQYKTGSFPLGYPTTIRTFYAPVDNVHGALMAMLDSAAKLRISMFAYSDSNIDQLLKTKSAGDFLMTLDDRFSGGQKEIDLLLAWDQSLFGTKVVVGTSSKGSLSHLKMVSIDDLYTITGSTNWTVSGQIYQDNQLTIIKNRYHAKEAAARIEAVHSHMLSEMTAKKLWPPTTTMATNANF